MESTVAVMPPGNASAMPRNGDSAADRSLHEACLDARLKDIEVLLAQGANPNQPFEDRSGKDVRQIFPLEALLSFGDRGDMTPKLKRKQIARCAQALLAAGAEIRPIERSILFKCCLYGLPEAMDLFVDPMSRIKRIGFELVMVSISSRQYEMLDSLAKHGISANATDAFGSNPFLELCSGQFGINTATAKAGGQKIDEAWYATEIQEMIRHGVDINARDKVGATGLMRAILCGQYIFARALLMCGADTSIALRNGVDAVHLAAACTNSEFLRFMMAHGGSRHSLSRLQARRIQPDIRAMVHAARIQSA